MARAPLKCTRLTLTVRVGSQPTNAEIFLSPHHAGCGPHYLAVVKFPKNAFAQGEGAKPASAAFGSSSAVLPIIEASYLVPLAALRLQRAFIERLRADRGGADLPRSWRSADAFSRRMSRAQGQNL
jgi:hypothetical protein